jgi:hypothetical protein
VEKPKNDDQKAPLTKADIETIIRIADRRVQLMAKLKEAIEHGDMLRQYEVARELVGLPPEDQVH